MSMMVPPGVLAQAARVFFKEYPDEYNKFMSDVGAEKIADIVNTHAIGAAAAGLAAGWVPGAGGVAALLASAGFIWAMYYRINTTLGIKLSKNVVKSIASAVLTNVVVQAAGALAGTVVASLISFIPFVGSVTASVIMAGIVYATVVASGIVYLKLLTNLFKAGCGGSIGSMSEDELKNAAKSAASSMDMKSVIKEAKNAYIKANKAGDISGKEYVDIEEFKN